MGGGVFYNKTTSASMTNRAKPSSEARTFLGLMSLNRYFPSQNTPSLSCGQNHATSYKQVFLIGWRNAHYQQMVEQKLDKRYLHSLHESQQTAMLCVETNSCSALFYQIVFANRHQHT